MFYVEAGMLFHLLWFQANWGLNHLEFSGYNKIYPDFTHFRAFWAYLGAPRGRLSDSQWNATIKKRWLSNLPRHFVTHNRQKTVLFFPQTVNSIIRIKSMFINKKYIYSSM